MDRQTIYLGAIPLETDLLHAQQDGMVALAKFSAAVLGATTIVNGFTCTPTSPASLAVNLTKGEVYQLEPLEATAWSSLAADTTDTILKQGIQLGTVQFALTPPATSGYSQVFLIEVQYQDLDTNQVVLPYFNAANPTQPFMGPGNSNSPQNTVRQGIVTSQVKAGVAAPSGSQVTPTADAGWTGLFAITVANGAATITAPNIAQVNSAPFIPVTLPNVPAGVQANLWTYAVDTGTASNLVINANPDPAAYTAGLGFWVKAAAAPTGASVINVLGQSGALLGNVGIVNADGSAIVANEWTAGAILGLLYDGSHFQLVSKSYNDLIDTAATFTVGGASSNFADLNAAMEYLSKFKITHNGSVILQYASGVYTYSSTVNINHPQNHRIVILGNGVVGNTYNGYVGNTAADMATLRGHFNTELHFTNGAGLEIDGISIAVIDSILLTGDGSTNPSIWPFTQCGLAWMAGSTQVQGNSLALGAGYTGGLGIGGFGNVGLYVGQGSIYSPPNVANLIIIGNGSHGLMSNAGSFAQPSGPTVLFDNGGFGVFANASSGVFFDSSVSFNNNTGGTYSPAENTVGNENSFIGP